MQTDQDGVAYGIHEQSWKPTDGSIDLGASPLAFLSEVSGDFGGGVRVEVSPSDDASWTISGKTDGAYVTAKAVTLETLKPALFSSEVDEYRWSQREPPVKMLHKHQGICYLAGIGGMFRGYGERIAVQLKEDGYWYLEGSSAQPELWAKAVALRWKNPSAIKAEIEERTWKAGDEPVELLPADQGLALLGTVSGNFAGGGEIIRLTHDQNVWRLSGQSGQAELSARALVIRIRR
jgi:hypothetical protein